MFGIGFTELLVIGIVALLVLGPEKLPMAASQMGKYLGMFRKTSDKFRREFYNSVYTPAQNLEKDIKKNLVAVVEGQELEPPAVPPVPAEVNPTESKPNE